MGVDSSLSEVQVWVYDAAEDGYEISVFSYGASTSVDLITNWNDVSASESVWSHSDESYSALRHLFVGLASKILKFFKNHKMVINLCNSVLVTKHQFWFDRER